MEKNHMMHLSQKISKELSNWWSIKNSQKKCDNMFHADWVSSGRNIVFYLYPCSRLDFSNGSIIFQGHHGFNSVLEVPSIRLVLDDSETRIDHAVVANPISHEVIEEGEILNKIIEMYNLSHRDVVTFGRKLKLLNVSIV